MISVIKQLVKNVFNNMGFDIIRIPKSPKYTLLGLSQFPIRSAIDIGANKGQFAKTILKVFPDAHIYCFEPLPDPFKELNKWAERQNGRVKTFNIALGDGEGTVEMFNHLEFSASSSLLRTTEICDRLYPFTKKQSTISVKISMLDKIMGNLSEPLVPDILIKLDVQGYEDRVIRGGYETFRKARACLLEVNLDKLYENQITFKDILFILYDIGFHYAGNLEQVYTKNGHVISIDAVFVNER